MLALLMLLAAGEGRPLFYWGARSPVMTVATTPAGLGAAEARVTEVHAAIDPKGIVLRFTLDRAAKAAMQLPDGTPVSGRLRAVLYLDTDDNRSTGLDQGQKDPRTGCDDRLEVGVVSIGEDTEEHRPASALLLATLRSLGRGGQRRTLWRGDADGPFVSAYGDSVDVRIPAEVLQPRGPLRLVLAEGDTLFTSLLK
jgi:hypothetical protein